MKTCPFCAESIRDAAVKCRYCGEWLDPSKRPPWSAAETTAPADDDGNGASAAAPRPKTPWSAPQWNVPATGTPAATSAAPEASSDAAPGDAPKPRRATIVGVGPLGAPPASDQGPAHEVVSSPSAGPEVPSGSAADVETTAGAGRGASLEEVARRIERIKESAAVVRSALASTGGAAPGGHDAGGGSPPPADAPAGDAATTGRSSEAPRTARGRTLIPEGRQPAPAPAPAPGTPESTGSVAERAAAVGPPHAREDAPSDAAPTPEPSVLPGDAPGDTPRRGEGQQTAGSFDGAEPAGRTSGAAGSSAARSYAETFFDTTDGDEDEAESSSGSHLHGSTLGSVIATRKPMPWGTILLAAAALVAVTYFTVGRDLLHGSAPGSTRPGERAAEPPVQESGVHPPAAAGPGAVPGTPPHAADPGAGAGTSPHVTEPASADGTPAGHGGQGPSPAPGDQGAEGGSAPPGTAETPLPPELATAVDEARELYKRGKRPEAARKLAPVIEARPRYAPALLIHAQILLEDGKMDEAGKAASTCVEVDPTMADCWLTVGVLAQNRGEKEEAVEAYRKYLELAPEGTYARDVKAQLARLER